MHPFRISSTSKVKQVRQKLSLSIRCYSCCPHSRAFDKAEGRIHTQLQEKETNNYSKFLFLSSSVGKESFFSTSASKGKKGFPYLISSPIRYSSVTRNSDGTFGHPYYQNYRLFWKSTTKSTTKEKHEVEMEADSESDIAEDKTQKSIFTRVADSFESNTTIHKSVILLGGSAIFGLSYLVYDVVFGFLKMKPLDMGLYGLYTGILSAGAGVGIANYLLYNFAISPEVAYQKSMNHIFYNKEAYDLIGGGYIRNAILTMKIYKQTGKYITLDGWMPVYDPITVHMMYVVKGSETNKPFLVTCSVQKINFKTEVVYLGLQKIYTDEKCFDTRPQWLGDLEVITGKPSEVCLQLANGASFNLDYKRAIVDDKIPIPRITGE